jgi:hypothetical protein
MTDLASQAQERNVNLQTHVLVVAQSSGPIVVMKAR